MLVLFDIWDCFFIGCFDFYGKCYDVMDEVSFGCNKYWCLMGGNLDFIDLGILYRLYDLILSVK